MPLTPEQRTLRARLAANIRWSKVRDRAAENAKARAAFIEQFERQVDPNGEMDPVTRARAAENARSAHYARLALRSAMVRAARKAGMAGGGTGDST